MLRDSHHLTSVALRKWYIICTSRDEHKANFLLDELCLTCRPMNFTIDRGHM